MAHMILEVTLTNNGFAELAGADIKYWAGEGLPSFEGDLEGFRLAYPAVFQELLDNEFIRPAN